MKKYFFILLLIGLPFLIHSCSNSTTTSEQPVEITSKDAAKTIQILLKGRVDFADGTYLESYDRERAFEIPLSLIDVNVSEYVNAISGTSEDDNFSSAACASYAAIMFSGSMSLSGLTQVTWTLSTVDVANWCQEYDEFIIRPRLYFNGPAEFNFNSSVERDGGSSPLYSGNTDHSEAGSGSYWLDGRTSTYSKSCGQYAETVFDDLKFTVFNQETSSFTITKAWIYLYGTGTYCAF